MDRLFDAVTDAINAMNDMDSGWWPFLFLRPDPGERLTNRRIACLSVLYGVMGGMGANVALVLSGEGSRPALWTFPLLASIGFFLLYKATFAFAWNRRVLRTSLSRTAR